MENKHLDEIRESFLKYISDKTIVFLRNLDLLSAQTDKLFAKAEDAFKELSENVKHSAPKELFCNAELIKKELLNFTTAELGNQAFLNPKKILEFHTKPQPSFNKQFELLIENLLENQRNGYTNYICCVSEQQAKRFHDIFEDQKEKVEYQTPVFSMYQGFIDEDSKTIVYSDHQIFERYHKFHLKNGYAKNRQLH